MFVGTTDVQTWKSYTSDNMVCLQSCWIGNITVCGSTISSAIHGDQHRAKFSVHIFMVIKIIIIDIQYHKHCEIAMYCWNSQNNTVKSQAGAPEAIQQCGGKNTVQATFVLQKTNSYG